MEGLAAFMAMRSNVSLIGAGTSMHLIMPQDNPDADLQRRITGAMGSIMAMMSDPNHAIHGTADEPVEPAELEEEKEEEKEEEVLEA